jgi:hypothetical protein
MPVQRRSDDQGRSLGPIVDRTVSHRGSSTATALEPGHSETGKLADHRADLNWGRAGACSMRPAVVVLREARNGSRRPG